MFDDIGMDFDKLSKLYKEDPEEFYRLREQMLSNAIEASSDVKRAKAMQWDIDQRLKKQPNDYARLVYIQERMHESLAKLRDALNEVVGVDHGEPK